MSHANLVQPLLAMFKNKVIPEPDSLWDDYATPECSTARHHLFRLPTGTSRIVAEW